MSWRIAIPSYRRAQRLKEATLSLLQKHQVPSDRIDVFVADNDEEWDYATTLTAGTYGRMIVAAPGMSAVRNFMTNYYDEGDWILFVDDDVTDFLTKTDEPLDFMKFIDEAFAECATRNLRLWGIHPIANRFFLKEKVSTDLRYIIGCFYGVINTKSITVDLEDAEDKLRTCLYYLADGGVLRYNWIAPKTKYYREKGGMQETRTLERQRASGLIMLERFPLLLHRKDKKDGRIEHRFCDKRPNVKPIAAADSSEHDE
jgi:hypothetical protein